MNTRLAVEVATRLERRWEGCRLSPYLCPAGVPTIGYGATYYENGERVTLLDPPITKDRADQLLLWMTETVYLPTVVKLCPRIDDPDRLGAIIDFTFNVGSKALKNSTVRKLINSGRWSAVPSALMKWVHGGSKTLPGLVLRRKAECSLL